MKSAGRKERDKLYRPAEEPEKSTALAYPFWEWKVSDLPDLLAVPTGSATCSLIGGAHEGLQMI